MEELIVDLHLGTERQGPGSPEDTLMALDLINYPTDSLLKIADIGCGNGGQTFPLAENLNAHITAVDFFPEFLSELESSAKTKGLESKISTLQCSMDDLPFEKESLDIIWSEGAIYIMGFEKGISYFNSFLKPGGYIAISEITWITNNRPKEIEDFWTEAYPEISTAGKKIEILEAAGFTLSGYFNLPESSWIKHYYEPLDRHFDSLLKKYNHSAEAKQMVQEYKDEIALYQKFKAYYSYGFYVAQKN